MRPNEGIDKIGLVLNPIFLNKENKKKHIDPFNRLSLHRAGPYTIFTITQEYFNPFIDYQVQLAFAVYELVKHGIIDFPDTMFTPYFIYKNHGWFVLNVVALEFYSSWSKDEIDIDHDMTEKTLDAAKENGCLYQYVNKETKEVTDTFYSNDKARNSYDRSSFIIYDKQKKDIRDNQIPRDVVTGNPKSIRTEFRLYADNTDWLHWDNLRGDYQAIFNRHKDLLAVIYSNYIKGCITTNCNDNKNFGKVVKTAERKSPIRYSGKKLKKRVTVKGMVDFGEENERQNRESQLGIFDKFSLKNKNIENAKNMDKIMVEAVKNRCGYYEKGR